ncbi:hypothetical protein [Saccharothrix sp. HUAS TT1]|uniref:hypothetical protein n=1 Tax=unclassified Saccharothrix TaxID=2593673 RepID=UPI00345BDE22
MAGTRKKPAKRTTKRKSKWTPEQIAQFRAADEARAAAADAVLEDPAAMQRMEVALRGASARVRGYSPRNRALLWTQAAEQGFRLTDVDTPLGWARRGRAIHPDHKFKGLRITAPRGDDEDKAQKDGASPEKPPTGQDAAGDEKKQPRFRMTSVFDVAQTVDALADERDDDGTTGPRTADEVAAEDAELLRQAEDADAFAAALAGQDAS